MEIIHRYSRKAVTLLSDQQVARATVAARECGRLSTRRFPAHAVNMSMYPWARYPELLPMANGV